MWPPLHSDSKIYNSIWKFMPCPSVDPKWFCTGMHFFELNQNILDKCQKTKTIPANVIFGVIEVKVQLVQNHFELP